MSRKARRPKRRRAGLNQRQALLLISLVLIGVGIGVYSNSLGHGFVFDDTTLIEQNPSLLELNLWELSGPRGYRPVRSLTYALNYWLGGLNPYGYHLFNVLLHSANGAILLWLIFVLTARFWLAVPAALLFTLHPIQTASVAYVSGRKDLLATFFLMAGLLSYCRFRQANRSRWLALAFVAFGLACLAKEVALVFPALVLIVEVVLAQRRNQLTDVARFILSRLKVLGLLGFASVLLLLYSVFWVQASRMDGFWGGSPITNYGTSLKLFVHYLKQIVLPHPLLADYSGHVIAVSTGLLEPATWVAAAVVLGYVLANIWAWGRDVLLGFSLSWFAIAIVPVLQIIPFHELAADHFLYLPSIGFSLLVGLFFEWMLLNTDFRILGTAMLSAVLAIYGWRTVERNRDWKSPITLWEATYRDAPNSFRANCNLGIFAFQSGDYNRALKLTEQCRRLAPDNHLAYANLGAAKREMGSQALKARDFDRAEALEREALFNSEKAIELNPEDFWSMSNAGDVLKDLALIQELRGDLKGANQIRVASLGYFKRALALGSSHPQFPQVYYKTGAVLVDGGHYQEAIPYLERSVAALPDYSLAQYVLGFSYYMLSEWEKALHPLEIALQLGPNPDLVAYLADTYRLLGRVNDAFRVLEEGDRRFPNTSAIHYNLGILFEANGNPALAKEHFSKALALEPTGNLASELKQRLEGN